MDEKIATMLKYVRLWGLLANWDGYIEMARKGNFSHPRLLSHIIEEEYKLKKENSRKMRLSRAKIPEQFVIETVSCQSYFRSFLKTRQESVHFLA